MRTTKQLPTGLKVEHIQHDGHTEINVPDGQELYLFTLGADKPKNQIRTKRVVNSNRIHPLLLAYLIGMICLTLFCAFTYGLPAN